jgi:hypothetical protein
MTTYGSLPGACRGPWCWTTTIAALEERGHRPIACTGDRRVGRWPARERLLGAPVVELPGCHAPFLSRPADLADALVGLRGRL